VCLAHVGERLAQRLGPADRLRDVRVERRAERSLADVLVDILDGDPAGGGRRRRPVRSPPKDLSPEQSIVLCMAIESPVGRRRATVHEAASGRETVVFVEHGSRDDPGGVVGRVRRAVGGGPPVASAAVVGPHPAAALAAVGVDPEATVVVLPRDPEAATARLERVTDAGLLDAVRPVAPGGVAGAEPVGPGDPVGPARVWTAGAGGSLAVVGADGADRLVHYERRRPGERAVGRHVAATGARPPARSASADPSTGERTDPADLLPAEPPTASERDPATGVTSLGSPEWFDRLHVHGGVPARVAVHETDATGRPPLAVGRHAGEAVADLPVDGYEWAPGAFGEPSAADRLSAARAVGLLLPAVDGAVTPAARRFAAALDPGLPVTPVDDGAELHDDRVRAAVCGGAPAFDVGLGDARLRVGSTDDAATLAFAGDWRTRAREERDAGPPC
jgi:hypothetical protein